MQSDPMPEDGKEMLRAIADRTGLDKATIWREIQEFVRYWTEKSKNGTRERWELQQTFEVDRRLNTWFSRAGKFEQRKGAPKGRGFTE